MIPLGEKSKREQMILEAKINREHMKMGLEEGRKDEEHDFKLKEQELKLKKAEMELQQKYQEMMLARADLQFKSDIEKTKLEMEMKKAEAEIHMDLTDRQMESQRKDSEHNVKMTREDDKHQLDLHKRASDAHMNQQLKYHSAKAKAKSDPEAPHDVPELDLRDIPKPKAFKQGTPAVFNPGNSGYAMGTKSVMSKVKMPNFAMTQGLHHGGIAEEKVLGGMGARMAQHPPKPQGYWFGIDDVPDPRKQQGAQIQQRVDSSGKPIQGNYVLADKPKPTYSPSTATLATAIGPQQRWEAEQKRKGQRGYEAGGMVGYQSGGYTLDNLAAMALMPQMDPRRSAEERKALADRSDRQWAERKKEEAAQYAAMLNHKPNTPPPLAVPLPTRKSKNAKDNSKDFNYTLGDLLKESQGRAHGGQIPHPLTGKAPTNPEAGPSDTVPAMLTPGEAVIPREAAQNPKNKPIIDKLIAEGRHVQKFGRGSVSVPGYALGQHHVGGYFEGTTSVDGQPSGVSDADVYWTNNAEATITAQNEEEEKRRKALQPVQNEDGSNQKMGVAVPQYNEPVQNEDGSQDRMGQQPKIEKPSIPPMEPVQNEDGSQDQMGTVEPIRNEPKHSAKTDEHFVAADAAEQAVAKSGAKDELGIAGAIQSAFKGLGDTFGMSNDEMKRMAIMAAGSRLLGYPMRQSVAHAFRAVSAQAEKRRDMKFQEDKLQAQEERQDKRIAAQSEREDKKIASSEKRQDERLEAQEKRTDARITAQNIRDDKKYNHQIALDAQRAREAHARDEYKAEQQYQRDLRLAKNKEDMARVTETYKQGREDRRVQMQGIQQLGTTAAADHLKVNPGDYAGAYVARHDAMNGKGSQKVADAAQAAGITKWRNDVSGDLNAIRNSETMKDPAGGKQAVPVLKLTGEEMAAQGANWMHNKGVNLNRPAEVLNMNNVMNNAVRSAQMYAKTTGNQVNDIQPFLERETIKIETGIDPTNSPLLAINGGKKMMDVKDVNDVAAKIRSAAADKLTKEQRQDPAMMNSAGVQITHKLKTAWESDPKLRDKYRESNNRSGFARFVDDEIKKYQSK